MTSPHLVEEMTVFDRLESAVQCYARSFPVLFGEARDSHLTDSKGRRYIDFLAGAGSLNYGHNNPVLKEKLIDYIASDGITHSLDLHTEAKERFLEAFESLILKPRSMDYTVQFTGPTGTNAVEAALKIARKVKGRSNVIAFTNGFHGVSLGAAAVTGNRHHRAAAGLPFSGTARMPFDGYLGDGDDSSIALMDKMLGDASSGIDHPAAVIVETVQGEGGLNVARAEWLREIEALCRKHDMLLIVDDIQAGCGRTGHFFSFEEAGISPDIITLSKSLSGYGLPFALTIFKPEYDVWNPGEHNGTFRGNNHAFVTAEAALREYWADDRFARDVRKKAALMQKQLEDMADGCDLRFKGRGMMCGVECASGDVASEITKAAFGMGLIIETSGPDSEVIKCLPPLTISEKDLLDGLDILARSAEKILGAGARSTAAA